MEFCLRKCHFWNTQIFRKLPFLMQFQNMGRLKKGSSVHKNPFLRTLYNRYICHITIVKWSRIIQKCIKKCNFWEIFILGPFSIKFLTVTLNIYQHQKEKSYRGPRDSFGNGMSRVTTWAGVEVATVQIPNHTSPYLSTMKIFFLLMDPFKDQPNDLMFYWGLRLSYNRECPSPAQPLQFIFILTC